MQEVLPTTKKITVYIYPSNGNWKIRYEHHQNGNGKFFRTPDEALQEARNIFKLSDKDPEIIITTSI